LLDGERDLSVLFIKACTSCTKMILASKTFSSASREMISDSLSFTPVIQNIFYRARAGEIIIILSPKELQNFV